MSIPLQITFHGVERSEALSASIERHAAKLERFSRVLEHCHVVIEAAEKHHHKGNRYRIHVHLKVPGKDIQAGHRPADDDHIHEDPYVVIRDVFDVARRQLQDYERTRRGDVKTHVPEAHGRVAQVYREADYGLIRTPEGREIHFHRHSLPGADFDKIETGTEVRFHEVPGEQGPWASTVHLTGTGRHRTLAPT